MLAAPHAFFPLGARGCRLHSGSVAARHEQLSDLRQAGAAVGAGAQALADLTGVRQAFTVDEAGNRVTPHGEAGAYERTVIGGGPERPAGEEREPVGGRQTV